MTSLFPSSASSSSYYLHEAGRARRRRRHGALVVAFALAAMAAYLFFAASTGGTGTSVQLVGQADDALVLPAGLPADMHVAGQGAPSERPATSVRVQPGSTVYQDDEATEIGGDNAGPRGAGEVVPVQSFRDIPVFRFDNLLVPLLPLGLIAAGARAALAYLNRRENQVNYGVYKGAMPYELHAARRRRRMVWTPRRVRNALFTPVAATASSHGDDPPQ